MKKIAKNILSVKIIWVLFFVVFLSLAPLPQRKASAWVDTIIPKVILPPMDELLKQLNIVITGVAKQGAIKMITQNVYMSVGGGNGGSAKFIVNWNTALSANPKKQAALYVEQLTKRSTQMKGSSFYQAVSSSGAMNAGNFEGVGEDGLAQYFQSPRFIDSVSAQSYSELGNSENYAEILGDLGQSIVDEASNGNPCPITYEGSPDDMFADGTFKNFSKFMSGNNDPWSYESCVQNVYEEKLEEFKKEAEVKAIAYQGFEGTEKNGYISYPGSLIKEKMANVEDMGNKVIANANGIAEVITSAVMKMGMDAMENGIGNVQANIQKGATNVYDKASTQVQNQVNNYGPGALYGNSSATSGN